MRNDVKPVIPPPRQPRRDAPPAAKSASRTGGYGLRPVPEGRGVPGDGSHFDARHMPSVRRERGDATDPAGPKRASSVSASSPAAVVTDPSGTTGPVSRSNDRLSTTTGKLRDRDLERSARMSAYPDVRALDIPLGDSTTSVPIAMAALAVLIGVLGLVTLVTFLNLGGFVVGVVIVALVIGLSAAAFFTYQTRPLIAIAAGIGAGLLGLIWLLGYVPGARAEPAQGRGIDAIENRDMTDAEADAF